MCKKKEGCSLVPYLNLFSIENHFKEIENIASVLIHGPKDTLEVPLLTIAIPTCRRTDLLKEAIESALAQDYETMRHEILIVDNEALSDDSKTTETERMVKKIEDPRIRYYRNQENLGMFGNFNRCLELARAEWVAFLHDDDLLYPDYLRKLKPLLEKGKDAGYVASNYMCTLPGEALPRGLRKWILNHPIRQMLIKYGQDKLVHLRQEQVFRLGITEYGAPTCGAVFNKAKAKELGGFDQKLFPTADGLFIFKMMHYYKTYRPICYFGRYRWLVNESLKKESIQANLYYHRVIDRFTRQHSLQSRIMDRIFRYEKYADQVNGCLTVDINHYYKPEDFDQWCHYRIRPIRFFLYCLIKKSQRRMLITEALLRR